MTKLSDPIRIRNLAIKNRIVLPPLVRFGWSDERGLVSDQHLDHYERIARAGTGLIIVEATCVAPDGKLSNDQLGLWDDEQIDGMAQLAKRCQAQGATVLIQLHHDGFNRHPGSLAELSLDDIGALQDAFVAATRRAQAAGFDGIELHGAHGYLLSQFMSPRTNQRDDTYGGSLENRARFALELVQRIKPLTNARFILGYRMGANAPTLADGQALAQWLQQAGVDLLNVSHNGGKTGRPVDPPDGFAFSWVMYLGAAIHRVVDTPVIGVMGIRTPEQARAALEIELVDMVAVGRGHLADPDWARHALDGTPIEPCRACKRCAWFSDGNHCPARLAAQKSVA